MMACHLVFAICVVAPLKGLGTRKENLEPFEYIYRNQIEMHVENEQVEYFSFILEVSRSGGIGGKWPAKKLRLTTWYDGIDACHDTGLGSTGK
jgi:hypothetical protein